jgi:GntR family transcriptional regulator
MDGTFKPVSTPLYRQLEEHLARQIYDGTLPPGSLLPSDAKLSEMYGVSRITVRTAVDHLANANLVRRKQGVGSFVIGPDGHVATARLIGYIDDIHPYMNFSMLGSDRRVPPPGIAAACGLVDDVACQCFTGVNHVGRAPLSYLEAYYPDSVAQFIAQEDFLGLVPPVRLIEMRSGLRFSHAKQRVTAVAAPAEIAGALGLAAGQPVIRMERIHYSAGLSVLDASVAYYHPQRYQMEIDIVPQARPQPGASKPSAGPASARPATSKS